MSKVTVTCSKCGSNNLTIPDEATDDSFVTCGGCGDSTTRWGDLKSAAINLAKSEAAKREPKNPGTEPIGNRTYFAQVHGIFHNNDDGSSRQQIIRQCQQGEELVLAPEPTNPHDPNAVKICRKNGQQLGYWLADGRMAHDLSIGWTYRVTVEEIYRFEDKPRKFGMKLRLEVLTMSRLTEARKKRAKVKAAEKSCSDAAKKTNGVATEPTGWFGWLKSVLGLD